MEQPSIRQSNELHQKRNRPAIACRGDTMYLQTFSQQLKPKAQDFNRGGRLPCSLRVDGICSTSVQIQSNKPENNFNLRTEDINLKLPVKFSDSRLSYSLCTADLPQAQTQAHRFRIRQHATNPLCPEYPGCNEVAVEPFETRFVKDPLNLEDIDGAKSHWRSKVKKSKLLHKTPADAARAPIITCKLQELVFLSEPADSGQNAKPKRQLNNSEQRHSSLDVRDIARSKAFILSKRCVDPVNPRYFYYDFEGRPNYLEPIKKSSSSVRHPVKNKPEFVLQTSDIEGAAPATNCFAMVQGHQRRAFHTTNDISGIHNAHPGSFKKSIKTKRCINPLERNYPLPTGFENGFAIGSEFKDCGPLEPSFHTGKRIIDHDSTIKEKNWNPINHKAKDPNVKWHFRSQGKMIDSKWIKPHEDIFLISEDERTFLEAKIKSNPNRLRDPIKGEGVEYKVLKAVNITDENVCPATDVSLIAKKNALAEKKDGQETFSCKTQTKPFKLAGEVTTANSNLRKKFNFDVSFKPLETNEQQFDAFIEKLH